MMQRPAAELSNGVVAGAILAAGIGSFTLGLLTIVAEASQPIKQALIWYQPAGPLSGKASGAVLVWLVTWGVLHRGWQDKHVDIARVFIVTLILMILSFLSMFPPFYAIFRGQSQ